MPSAKIAFPLGGPAGCATGPIQPPGSRRGLLVETLQIVEPKKYQPVPNHLLESKLYSKGVRNSVAQARPSAVHFKGFELGKLHTEILEIDNISSEVIRMHIIPPQTKYFYVKYTKGDRLVPGMSIQCTVEFYPDEWRYYYDCIRIHTPGEENLIIPIHAYPLLDTSEWPQLLDFQDVPVGQMATKLIPLRCQAPIDFEFELSTIQHHPAFTIDPRAGIVPAHGDVDIVVTFRPTEFSTAQMKVQLTYSQFNAQPLICTIMGGSKPGLAKDILTGQLEHDEPLDPRSITPSGRAKRHKLKKKADDQDTSSTSGGLTIVQEVSYKGIKFPTNLDNPSAVAQVLNQEAGKIRIKDLREAIIHKSAEGTEKTRQMKVALFEKQVRDNVHEERQNQLRWQTRLGDDQIDQNEREQILNDRVYALQHYAKKRGDPVEAKELKRAKTEVVFRRTRRSCEEISPAIAQFDLYSINMWPLRMEALERFQQAACKIILRNRVNRRLIGVRVLAELRKEEKQHATKHSAGSRKKAAPPTDLPGAERKHWKTRVKESKVPLLTDMAGDRDLVQAESDSLLDPTKLKTNTFDRGPGSSESTMSIDLKGMVPYLPTEVEMPFEVPRHQLQPPIEYIYRGLTYFKVYELSQVYEPLGLARPLRTGAEEEVAKIGKPLQHIAEAEATQTLELVKEEEPDERSIAYTKLEEVIDESVALPFDPIQAPTAIFQPVQYPALHVFNPAPGVQTFQPPLPYQETDLDFHLCPIPRYVGYDFANPHMTNQKPYLDRKEVIPGLMAWQRFPSQSLVSLGNTPTLTNVWVPRWNDPFESALMPTDVPPLQDHLADSDMENIEDEDQTDEDRYEACQDVLHLTPDMVEERFTLLRFDVGLTNLAEKDQEEKKDMFPHGPKMPPTNLPVGPLGPIPREKREIELNYYLTRKSNRLGNRLQYTYQQMDGIKNNKSLILKWNKPK